MNLRRLTSRDAVPEPRPNGAQRQAAVRALEAALGHLDAEFHDGRALAWIIGGPLIRVERVRVKAEAAAQLLTATEQVDLNSVLDNYERLFEAVAAAQQHRGKVGANDPLVLSPEVRRQLESARGATQTLLERLEVGAW